MDSGVLIKLVGGLAMLGVGVRQMLQLPRRHRSGVRALGTVVGQRQEWDSENDAWCHWPVIAFADEHGVKREFTADSGTAWHLHPVGENVPVVYPHGRPEDAQLNSAQHRALWSVPFGLYAVFILGGVLVLASLVRSLLPHG